MKIKFLALLLFIGMVSATTITLNESNGGNVGDSFTYGSGATTNYGTYGSVAVATSIGSATYGWVMFNLSSAIPYGATITNANLSMYMFIAPLLTKTYQAYNTTAAWTETGITWNNQPGADTLQDSMATGTTAGVWLSWNVTPAALASFNSPYPMRNLSIRISDSAGIGTSYAANFTSRDNATTASRPQLYITYTLPACTETGLVGYWKFDENTGNYAYDSSGCGGNTGTLAGATWTTGKNYQTPYALSYNGVNQYVSGLLLQTTITMNFTISMWVKPSTSVGSMFELDNATSNWVVYINTVLKLWNGTADVYNSGTTIPLGTWTFVAITYNGTHVSSYVNGVFISSTAVGSSILKTPTSPSFRVGTDRAVATWFNGTIDEVKILNISWSASQVMAEYTNYCLMNLINIIAYNESASSQEIAFNLMASNTTSSFSYSNANPFTDYYCNSSFPTGSATFSISNTSFYSPRYYYSTLTAGGNYSLNAYLLPLNDLYATSTTIYVKDSSGASIVGATVSMYKQISSVWTLMAQDTTDSIGGTYFNLDSATMYELFANDTCCIATSITLQPTQAVYTITMQTSSTSNQSIFNFTTQGVSWNVTPSSYLLSGTQNFNFSIYNTNNDFEFWGIRVYYNGTQQYFSNQTTSLGGYVNYTMNASDTTDNSINVSIFFKRIGGTYFDPTYQYWGHSISTSNLSLVDAMVRIGDSALSPLTKGIIAAVFITCIAGYVGTAVSFSGGVVLELLMLWGFASFGFIQITPLLMLTLIGGALIYNRHFALTPVG